jgi:hypothetical protein
MSSLSSWRWTIPLLAGIMLAGLLLRLVFFSASLPFGGFPLVVDEGNYFGIAGPLSEGQGFVDKWAWLRPPGYPAFLAFFLVVWRSLPAAALAQILLSVANIGLVYALAMEIFAFRPDFPRRRAQVVGLVAAGLLAVNPHAVLYSNLFMPETLYMLALTIMAWALLRGIRSRSDFGFRISDFGFRKRIADNSGGEVQDGEGESENPKSEIRNPKSLLLFALAGLAAAIAIYLRSLLLTFVPLMLAWVWWVLSRDASVGDVTFRSRLSWRSLLPIAVFLAAMFGAILPWTVRNYFEYNRFMLVDAVGGLNIWQYNDDISRDEVIERLMEIPNPVDRDRYASEQGVRAILANPVRFASDAVERFADSWPVESFTELRVSIRDKYPGMDCTYMDIYAWLETAFYITLGLLAIWGFALAPGRAFKGLFFLFLLHYAVTTMFAHAEFRYRMPLYPFASLYAGWTLANFGFWILDFGFRRKLVRTKPKDNNANNPKSKIQNPKLAALVVSLLFLVQSALIAVPGVWKGIRFERRYLEGKGQMERGDYAGALASFLGAEEIDKGCACLYRQIGLAHGKLGELDEERAAYMTALSREEYDWRTSALLSDRLRAVGNPRAPDPIRFTRPEYRAEQQVWAWDNLSPSPVSQLDVGGADIGYLKGFEALETEPAPEGDITYRWTTGHAYARLTPPLGAGTLQLTVRWHSLAWPGKSDSDAAVRVLLNGREVGTLMAHPGWESVTLDLPLVEGTGQVVIELFTPTARPPGPETRLLGVAVDSLKLERVQGAR